MDNMDMYLNTTRTSILYELSAALCLQIDTTSFVLPHTKEKTQVCAWLAPLCPLQPAINSHPAQMMNKIEMLCIVLCDCVWRLPDKIRVASSSPGSMWVLVSRWNILICFTRMFVSTCWPALLLCRQSPAAGFHYVIMLSPADWSHPLPQSLSLSPPPCFSWLPTHLPAAATFQFRNSSELWMHNAHWQANSSHKS